MRAYLWPKTERLPAVTTRRLKESFHSFRKEPGSVWKGKVSRLSRRFREREAQLINLSAAFQQRYLLKPFCCWLRLPPPPSCIQAIAAPDYHRNSAERQPCPQGRPSAPRPDAAARPGAALPTAAPRAHSRASRSGGSPLPAAARAAALRAELRARRPPPEPPAPPVHPAHLLPPVPHGALTAALPPTPLAVRRPVTKGRSPPGAAHWQPPVTAAAGRAAPSSAPLPLCPPREAARTRREPRTAALPRRARRAGVERFPSTPLSLFFPPPLSRPPAANSAARQHPAAVPLRVSVSLALSAGKRGGEGKGGRRRGRSRRCRPSCAALTAGTGGRRRLRSLG